MAKIVVASLLILSVCGISSVPAQELRARQTSAQTTQAPRTKSGELTRDHAFSLDSIDDVLWWLPEDTQTVSVVRGPFKAGAPISEPPEDMPAIEQLDLTLRMAPLEIFYTIKKGRFYKNLVGRNVLFGVKGSRRFRPPTGLGEMLFEGCDIVILESSLGPTRDALLKQMASQAKQVQTIAGQQVVLFEETLESDTWKVFICVPAPDVLLCATNRGFLTQVLNRMHQRGQKRALPESLPEWKHVDTAARFWAVRHYDKGDAKDDPSSPLSGNQDAANWPDTEAVGIVFDFDPSRSKTATVKYLSGNKDALKVFASEQSQVDGFKPVIRLAEPGVVEMVVNFSDPEEASTFLLVLLGLLGRATYL
ncbi:MAG TPA: hypothetical protein VNS63_11765 [Blastocatellia bacterium]|nr:hypothetical protein [Blastocatellia bacterium]